MARDKNNPIYDQLQLFSDRIRQVARGHRTACACDGPAGVGKTYTLRTVCAEEGKRHELINTTTGGLIQMLYRYANTAVVAFDDFDVALRSEATANVIKQMIAPEPKRRITHQTVKSLDNLHRASGPKINIAPPTFTINCGLVMLTNVDMGNMLSIDRDMRNHVSAMVDRGLEFIHISRNLNYVADYVLWLATEQGLLQKSGLHMDTKQETEVTEFFRENVQRFETVSVRRFQSIAKDRLTMPERWRQLQMATFKRTKDDAAGTKTTTTAPKKVATPTKTSPKSTTPEPEPPATAPGATVAKQKSKSSEKTQQEEANRDTITQSIASVLNARMPISLISGSPDGTGVKAFCESKQMFCRALLKPHPEIEDEFSLRILGKHEGRYLIEESGPSTAGDQAVIEELKWEFVWQSDAKSSLVAECKIARAHKLREPYVIISDGRITLSDRPVEKDRWQMNLRDLEWVLRKEVLEINYTRRGVLSVKVRTLLGEYEFLFRGRAG